jgi:hypothetical protein
MGGQDPFNFSKWILITGAISIVIGFWIFHHGCNNMEATKERKIMAMTKTNSMPSIGIPPIDDSAPLKSETATFALG